VRPGQPAEQRVQRVELSRCEAVTEQAPNLVKVIRAGTLRELGAISGQLRVDNAAIHWARNALDQTARFEPGEKPGDTPLGDQEPPGEINAAQAMFRLEPELKQHLELMQCEAVISAQRGVHLAGELRV